ncbi:MAG: DUF3870 domain-containing protein [Oscillospiraceae bacterium]|nr:DUF3870 domain-containing protein [Oscillospiraceae bacterium]
MKYKSAYFCGYAKLPSALPTNVSNCTLTLGLEIEVATNKVINTSVTLLSSVAQNLIHEYFYGKDVVAEYEQIVDEISFRHQGIAQKPIIKAYNDILHNYLAFLQKYK